MEIKIRKLPFECGHVERVGLARKLFAEVYCRECTKNTVYAWRLINYELLILKSLAYLMTRFLPL